MYSEVTSDTVVVWVTFRMKTSTARIIPASTATVRSAKNGQQKCHQPSGNLEPGLFEKFRDFPPFSHIVGDHQQDGG
jgi:hypothetical protein